MIADAGLLETVRGRLADRGAAADEESIGRAVRECGVVLDRAGLARLVRAIRDEIDGLGPLDELTGDESVTDILVNGPDEVWIDRGGGLQRATVRFRDEAAVRALGVRLAARAGRRLDDAVPYVDARLPGGQRLHAVLPPLSVRGTTISLRIPGRRRFSVADLVRLGSVDPASADVLAALVASRAAFLVSGGTGSGKTAVLGALLGLVPADERILIVEDTAELRPEHPHVVSLEARPANVEGVGEIPLRTLVRQALRMRPDRLVVGEVRGAEVVDMLAGFNTGHEGGCGTVHANSALAVPARIVALALAAGMSRSAAHAQLAAGLDIVLHLARRPDGSRVVSEVGLVRSGPDGAWVELALVRQGSGLGAASACRDLRSRLGLSP